MASWQARVVNGALRAGVRRTWTEDLDVAGARRHGARSDRVLGRGRRFTALDADGAGGVPAEWIGEGGRTILYLHGGAFILHLPRTYRDFGRRLSALTGARVLLPDYRLAPEHRFPAGAEDCATAYRWLVEEAGVAPESIALVGDSAGGYMVLSTLQRTRDAGLPMPGCAVLISGAYDLAFDDPSVTYNRRRDPMFKPVATQFVRRNYLADEADIAAASPLRAPLHGLPPLLFQVGSTEMLLDQSVRAAERVRAAGGSAALEVYPGAPHVFQVIPFLPETKVALASLTAFVQSHTTPMDVPAATASRTLPPAARRLRALRRRRRAPAPGPARR